MLIKDELWLEHAKTSVIYLFIFEWDIPKNLRKSHAQQHNLSSHKITTAWAIDQSKSMRRVFSQEVRGSFESTTFNIRFQGY